MYRRGHIGSVTFKVITWIVSLQYLLNAVDGAPTLVTCFGGTSPNISGSVAKRLRCVMIFSDSLMAVVAKLLCVWQWKIIQNQSTSDEVMKF